jgi:hypothetical protein
MGVLVNAIYRQNAIFYRSSAIYSAYNRRIEGRMDFAGWSVSGKVAPRLK